jgi:hypothetical protein
VSDRTKLNDIARRGEDPVVIALARGASKEDAAAIGGVSRGTVFGWLKDDEFRGRVQYERQRLVDRAVGRLADRSARAVDGVAKRFAAPVPAGGAGWRNGWCPFGHPQCDRATLMNPAGDPI